MVKSSKREALHRRVRETISSLPDDALMNVVQNSPRNYTPFALRVARDELKKRRQGKSLHKDRAAVSKSKDDDSQRVERHTDPAGCYVELWRDRNFEGDYLLIEGPVEHETLNCIEKWGDDISSLRVGPNAFVITYQKDSFKGEMICFGPCQEVADMSQYEFDNEIESMKLINSVKIFECARHVGEK
jgi:hypothetical protein